MAVLAYLLLVSYHLSKYTPKIFGDSRLAFTIFILSIIFSASIIQAPTIPALIRFVIFIPVLLLNFFFIPSIIPRDVFYGSLARITALSTLIGLPALVLGSFGPVQAYPVISSPPGLPVALPGLMSVFGNPNTMGALAVYGTLAALWEYLSFKRKSSLILIVLNSLGVYLSQGRAAALALFVGLTLVGIYYVTNRVGLAIVSVGGLVTAPVLILINFGVIPGPDFVRSVDLNNRVQLWTAAYRAMLERPFFGLGLGNVSKAMASYITRPHLMGAGPHTSYIRMFAASGIIGGVLYIYLYLKSMSNRLITIADNADASEYGMVLGVVVLHTFSGLSIFGLAFGSVIPAIILGYAQRTQ